MAGRQGAARKIIAVAVPFLAARARADAAFRDEKAPVDERQLAAIEQREGRGANWHVVNVMIRARRVIDLLPTTPSPVIDPPPFDAAMAGYAGAVKDMDAYSAAIPTRSSCSSRSLARCWANCATSRRRSTAPRATRGAAPGATSPGLSTTTI